MKKPWPLGGVCMELDDCAVPLLKGLVPTRTSTRFKGVKLGLLVGAVPAQGGNGTQGSARINGKIFTGRATPSPDAASDVRVLVVAIRATPIRSSLRTTRPACRRTFFAMTALDENRAKSQLAKKAGVIIPPSESCHLGHHSATMYPDFANNQDQRPAVPASSRTKPGSRANSSPHVQQRARP